MAITMKRFDQELGERSRPIKKPKDYAYYEGKAFIEVKGPKHAINLLLDSGSNRFHMNQDTARWLEIATQGRD